MTDLEARYQMALEEILCISAGVPGGHLVYELACKALDLPNMYAMTDSDAECRKYLGIHPSNDPRVTHRFAW